jgi:hypothetical protein
MGHRVSAGEEDTAGWHITSASHAHGRTADGGKWCSGAVRGSGGSVVHGGK